MMGIDGGRRLFEQETSKARDVRGTLARFGSYFGRYWLGLAVAFALIIASSWSQVVSPEYIGQAIDCYLFPQPTSVCWFDPDITSDSPIEDKFAGLGRLSAVLGVLYVATSVLNGLAFFAMSRTGQFVLRQMREDVSIRCSNCHWGFTATMKSAT